MRKILHTESTLTDRYQTTVPEAIRNALHLERRDKIVYTIEANGKVTLSRANEEDPMVNQFLSFLVNDIEKNPDHIRAISPTLLKRAQSLISGIEIDLDQPLSDEQE